MKKLLSIFLLFCLMLSYAVADQPASFSLSAPDGIRPYSEHRFTVTMPEAGEVVLTLHDPYLSYEIARVQAEEGDTEIIWNGLMENGEAPRRGTYTLTAQWQSNTQSGSCDISISVKSQAYALQYCIPSSDVIYAGHEGFTVNYLATSENALIYVFLSTKEDPDTVIRRWSLQPQNTNPHNFTWNGQISGNSVDPGEYYLTFSVKNSPQEPIRLAVTVTHDAPPALRVETCSLSSFMPESSNDDDIWEKLMQPITVIDIGYLNHQSVYEQPDSRSRFLGTLHGQTHAVAVLDLNVNGYARIGTWRQEDGSYIEGYVPQRRLKVVSPNSHYGLVIDKKTQTLTVWQDGKALGTLSVSTGLMAKNKLFRETLAGAFLTSERSALFNDNGFAYHYAIRIDGGNLIHSVGSKTKADKWDYSIQLEQLGQKASHGCIRIDPRAGEAGLNMYWLWTHLPMFTKVIVLDDPEAREARMSELNPTPVPATPTPVPTETPVPTPSPVPTDTPVPTPTPELTPTPEPHFEGILGYRSRGLAVLQLQERLTELNYYSGELDGLFGDATHKALVAFQKANGLGADGLAGEKTYAALWGEEAISAPTPSPTPSPTSTPEPTEVPTPSPIPTDTPVPTVTPTPSPSPTPTPIPPDTTTITITMAGDTLLGSEDKLRNNEKSFDSVITEKGYAYPLQNFAELFANDDLTYLNLECVLRNDSRDKMPDRPYNFRGPTAFVEILTSSSVEHVNLANNHYIDYGYSGRRITRETLDEAGITYSGYTNTWIYEKDGVKIGFGGVRETIWKQDRTIPTKEIKALREAGCNYIIYACHFGKEYSETHNKLQTQIAHAIIDAGADMVVGTHPHVVQGIEIYNGKPIFYSLGNFVFGGNLTPTDYDGLAVQLQMHFNLRQCIGVTAKLIPLMTSGIQNGETDFCPVIAKDDDKARILDRIQYDSEIEIAEVMHF